jgi:aspartate carbamoyltransferase catalytic subunit
VGDNLKVIEAKNIEYAYPDKTMGIKNFTLNIEEYERVKDSFVLRKEDLKDMKSDAIIMHPLPRVTEIHPDVDVDPRAKYFDQTAFGLMLRKAVLASVLEKNWM